MTGSMSKAATSLGLEIDDNALKKHGGLSALFDTSKLGKDV